MEDEVKNVLVTIINLVINSDELESIQTEDEVKNVLVTIINLVINSGDAKAMVRRLWKAVELHEQLHNKIQRNQPIKIV
jgi:hypothetical protein